MEVSLSSQVASVLMVSDGWVSLRLPELDEKESDMERSERGHSRQRAQPVQRLRGGSKSGEQGGPSDAPNFL